MTTSCAAISTSSTERAVDKPFWESLGDVDFESYWVLSLDTYAHMAAYFDVIEDPKGLALCLKETRHDRVCYFALVESDYVIPFASISIVDTGEGYIPRFDEHEICAPISNAELRDAADFVAKAMSVRDYGHNNEVAIAQAEMKHGRDKLFKFLGIELEE